MCECTMLKRVWRGTLLPERHEEGFVCIGSSMITNPISAVPEVAESGQFDAQTCAATKSKNELLVAESIISNSAVE